MKDYALYIYDDKIGDIQSEDIFNKAHKISLVFSI